MQFLRGKVYASRRNQRMRCGTTRICSIKPVSSRRPIAEVKDAAAKLTVDVYASPFAPATEEAPAIRALVLGAGGDLKKSICPKRQSAPVLVDLVEAAMPPSPWSSGARRRERPVPCRKAAMQQNGVWNFNSVEKSGIPFASFPSPCPMRRGSRPDGGEVLTLPLTKDEPKWPPR